MYGTVRIGTAGWRLPAEAGAAFPSGGSHLERYASVFNGVEINSSFHRSHKATTYQRWAACTPDTFRFAVKVPKDITHVCKLCDVGRVVDRFLSECAGLGNKLGPLLVQLPPSLAFSAETVERFFTALKDREVGAVVCEPRHASWFEQDANHLFVTFRIGRVAADPCPVPQANQLAGWGGLTYFRLHGSPRVYHSSYGMSAIRAAVKSVRVSAAAGSECWCIFDNTASGAATANALTAAAAIAAT